MMTANEEMENSSLRLGIHESVPAEDKNNFVAFRLSVYEPEEQWHNDDLSEYVAEDFHLFPLINSRTLNSTIATSAVTSCAVVVSTNRKEGTYSSPTNFTRS